MKGVHSTGEVIVTVLLCVKSEVGLVCRATIMFNHWCNAGLPCMTSHMAGHSSSTGKALGKHDVLVSTLDDLLNADVVVSRGATELVGNQVQLPKWPRQVNEALMIIVLVLY
jgi:polysaccharide pyruvyl transferase WcaK-like protein